VGFVAMVVPVGSWRFTSETDEGWTCVAMSTMTQTERYDQMPDDEALVVSFQTRVDALTNQLRNKQKKQVRANGFVAAIQHFELYVFDDASEPPYKEFMLFINCGRSLSPLRHIRFDWTAAMQVPVPQLN